MWTNLPPRHGPFRSARFRSCHRRWSRRRGPATASPSPASCPDLAQCADRALEAFNRKAIDAATYKAIRARCAEAGAALAPALRIAHATPGFNNSKRRRPAQLAERRVCLICGEEKPIEASYRTSTGKSREKECRACQDSERRAG